MHVYACYMYANSISSGLISTSVNSEQICLKLDPGVLKVSKPCEKVFIEQARK